MHKGAIELPPIKYLEEVGREDDPKYCHFHRGINHPTSQCYQLRRIIQDCIDKGIVRPKNAPNASSNKISVSTEEVTRKRGRKKSSTEDEARDFVCPKDLPDVSRILPRRRNGKIRKKKLQRERQERLKDLIPFRPRWNRLSSREQPFTMDDDLQSEGLHSFYKRMKVSTLKVCPLNRDWGHNSLLETPSEQDDQICSWDSVWSTVSNVLSDEEIQDPGNLPPHWCKR